MPRHEVLGGAMRIRGLAFLAASAVAVSAQGQFGVATSFASFSRMDQPSGYRYYPPDTEGVAGLTNVVVVNNSSMAIYDRLGNLQSFQTLRSMIPGAAAVGDNRLKYDPLSDRYFLSTTDFADKLYIGVSKTGNPNDGFRFYSVNPRVGEPNALSDFPTFAVTKDGIYLGVDLYASPSDWDPASVNLIAIKKADVLNDTFSGSSYTINNRTGARWTKGSWQGLDDPYGTMTDQKMVATSWYSSNVMHSSTVTLGGGGFTVSDNPDIPVTPYTQPGGAPQLGTGTGIQTNDSRLFGTPYYMNGMIWTVQNADLGGTPGLQWNENDASTGALIDSGTIGGAGQAAYFGSVAVNEFGDIVIGYSGSDATSYASAYAIHGTVDGFGHVTMGSSILLHSGTGANTSGRFGDYSETMVDPLDHHYFWTTQEYAQAGIDWGTFVARLGPTAVPEPATLAILAIGGLSILRRKRSGA